MSKKKIIMVGIAAAVVVIAGLSIWLLTRKNYSSERAFAEAMFGMSPLEVYQATGYKLDESEANDNLNCEYIAFQLSAEPRSAVSTRVVHTPVDLYNSQAKLDFAFDHDQLVCSSVEFKSKTLDVQTELVKKISDQLQATYKRTEERKWANNAGRALVFENDNVEVTLAQYRAQAGKDYLSLIVYKEYKPIMKKYSDSKTIREKTAF